MTRLRGPVSGDGAQHVRYVCLPVLTCSVLLVYPNATLDPESFGAVPSYGGVWGFSPIPMVLRCFEGPVGLSGVFGSTFTTAAPDSLRKVQSTQAKHSRWVKRGGRVAVARGGRVGFGEVASGRG